MTKKVTSGSRWRGLEPDLYEQRSESACHRQRWIGPKDCCSDPSTAPTLDPTGRSGGRSRGGKRRFERTDGRAPPGPDPRRHRFRDLDGTRPGLGSIAPAGRLHHLPVELRHANRQQHCSADVCEQVPYVRRIRNGGAPLPDVVMSRHRGARRVSTRVARVSPAISQIVR